MKRPLLALAAALALAAPAVHAIEYQQVQPAQSQVGFSYKQMGVGMDGHFRKFSGQLAFDPARPSAARVSLEVDLASIDTGTAEADREVAGKPWFNIPAFPTARFESNTVKDLGNNRYEVSGTLSIKGKQQPVTVPARFSTQGSTGVFEGSFTIRRGDFAIGEGSWSSPDIVANEVQVSFRIAATGK